MYSVLSSKIKIYNLYLMMICLPFYKYVPFFHGKNTKKPISITGCIQRYVNMFQETFETLQLVL